jgi:ribosomal protein L7Ae-like RNA K-turn-binding protein
VTIGVDAVRKDLQAGKCWCVVVAEDASPRTMDKVVRLAAAKEIPLLPGPSAAAIGAQLGKPPVMAVGVRDRALAGGMVQLAPARS